MKRLVLLASALIALARTNGRAAEPQAKFRELEEILRSKNDNDPRLDRDFDALSIETKRLFRRKYAEIPAEKRNERGTIVYLLGRNLRSHEDWAFLREVALEPPCLSLRNCSKKPAADSDEEATGDEITLAYPSLVALRQAAQASLRDKASKKEALNLFAAAKASRTRAVVRMAALDEKKLSLP